MGTDKRRTSVCAKPWPWQGYLLGNWLLQKLNPLNVKCVISYRLNTGLWQLSTKKLAQCIDQRYKLLTQQKGYSQLNSFIKKRPNKHSWWRKEWLASFVNTRHAFLFLSFKLFFLHIHTALEKTFVVSKCNMCVLSKNKFVIHHTPMLRQGVYFVFAGKHMYCTSWSC